MRGKITVLCALVLVLTAALSAQITFTQTGYTTGDGSGAPVTGDFNGDGRPDFATPVYQNNEVQIYLNSGSGKFAFKSSIAVSSPKQVQTADINGDGKLDLLVTPDNGGMTVQTFLGAGDGSFVPGITIALQSVSFDLELADLNGDHKPDFVMHACYPSRSSLCNLTPFINDGSGNFTAKSDLISSSGNTAIGFRTIAIGDFNHDGKADVAFALKTGFDVFYGHGDGTFSAPAFKSANAPTSIAAGSFNHDTYTDLVLATAAPCSSQDCSNYASVYLNDGSGHFPSLRSRTLIHGNELSVTDINGDGILDIVGVTPGHFYPGSQYILGHGDGTFGSAQQLPEGDVASIAVPRDVNLDGRHDLLEGENLGGSTDVYLNNNAAVICTPPGSASLAAKICSPGSGATVAKTFTVKGSGNSPLGVQRLELWVDGKKKAEALNDQIKSSVTVAAGTHKVTVVSVSQFGSTASKSIFVHAQ
jgi:hypothetical protein